MLLPHLYPGAGLVCSPVPPVPSTPPRDDLEACHPQRPLPYVPNLPQPSVVMLYSGPALERADQAGMGQRSPTSQEGILGKRKMEEVKEEEEEEGWGRKRALSEVEQSYEVSSRNTQGEGVCKMCPAVLLTRAVRACHQTRACSTPLRSTREKPRLGCLETGRLGDLPHCRHTTSTSPTLQGSLSTLMPYVLVPTSALSAYPILTNGASPTCGDGQGKISFGMPAMVSPTHFVVGASTFAVPGVPTFGAPTTAFSNPDQTAPTDSPREPTGLLKMDPQTPLTPKEAAVTTSQAFFQTPGTLGSTTSPPASRRRGSAQRRLDIGHPTAN
ncbi:hypothetical protein JZ751_022112 [Albula glossodonta]|uniref:Uncharacterized protein n=1 Tax=Albula glossodonta TaxID=121402 RepID=A0A8T2NQV7_9TELE|nr:hypothetical protein JZ751_022112 [Albula glossodonta]